MNVTNRLDAIDGIRGVAALAVAILHYQHAFGLQDDPLKWGELPVDLFFILSGFIISKKYFVGLTVRAITPVTFLVHRISRMWPLHIVALLLLLGQEYIAIRYHLDNFHVLSPADSAYAFFLNVFLLHCVGLYTYPNFNLPSWSISSELAINVIWMFLVLRGWWTRTLALLVTIAGALYVYSLANTFNICAPCNGYPGVNTGLVKTALGFALGCLLFWCQESGFRLHRPGLVAAFAGLGLTGILAFYPLLVQYYADFAVVLIFFPLITTLAIQDDNWLSVLLGSGPLRWLGRISFSIYLLHVPFYNALGYLMLISRYPSPPTVGFVFIGGLLLVSHLSYLTIERGGIWAIRRLAGSAKAKRTAQGVLCEQSAL